MESEKKINWLSLFIRTVIIFLFVLIIIWLIFKIFGGNRLSDTFKENIKNMETVSINYFKTVDLPLEKGQELKITLEEMIQNDMLLIDNEEEPSCDRKESYSKIVREKDSYLVTTKLKCGKEEDTIKKKFSLEDCKNCHITSNADKDNNDESSNNSSSVTYYEYEKSTVSYTDWMRGAKTGDGIENRYEYYSIDYATYYTIGIVKKGQNSVSYTLKLDSVPNKKYYFTTIEEINGLDKKEEKKFLEDKNVSISKGTTIEMKSLKNIEKYSLGNSNITYKINPYYRRGAYYINVKVTINNTDNITSYHDSKTNKDVYLIPLKIKVKFASDQITSAKPKGLYETIPYYRYVIVNKDTIWSTEDAVEGYTKTGRTKTE